MLAFENKSIWKRFIGGEVYGEGARLFIRKSRDGCGRLSRVGGKSLVEPFLGEQW